MHTINLKNSLFIFFAIGIIGCSKDQEESSLTLEQMISNADVVLDNVIACAAKIDKDTSISVFFYPREGATDLRYFETENTIVDKNNFKNYREVKPRLLPVFNGYLNKFEVASSLTEKWVIVSFREDNKIHLSNPIRLKQLTKPTEYLPEKLTINSINEMPKFSWEDGMYQDTKIYFQVISDANNNLFSGTYTFEKQFQYYKLNNVVLNITTATPPELQKNNTYNFTLMAVSEDNWVNLLMEKTFTIEN